MADNDEVGVYDIGNITGFREILTPSSYYYDFGETFVDSVANYELVVTNTGRRYADILRAEVSLGSEVFAAEFGELPRLFPGDSATLSIVFQPDSAIVYEGVLSVFFGADTIADTLEVELSGLGIPNVGVLDSYVSPPRLTMLLEVSPNPFNSSAQISFSLPEPGNVEIAIFDLAGRMISSRVQFFTAGEHKAIWNAISYPTGQYLIRASTNGTSITQKALLLR